jgi:creatinine amidohydrolase
MKLKTVFMAELTNQDIDEYLKEGNMVIIPVGSLEQHGAHAPLGTDVMIPREIARRVAIARNALVAPALNYGLSVAHQGFSGLATIGVRTLLSLAEDLCISFAKSGFRKIVFLNGHYTNSGTLTMACYEASGKIPEGTQAYQISYWEALPPDQLEEYISEKAGLHANIGETSAIMAIDPSLVDLSKAKVFWPDFPKFGASPGPALIAYFDTQVGANFQALPFGSWGDPTKSSVEKGKIFLDQIEKAVLRLMDEIDSIYERLGPPKKK